MELTEPRRPAAFFDKDGTLVENVPYNIDCARLRLVAGGGHAVRMLHDAGYAIVVVTNQAGIARGYFTVADLRLLEAGLRDLLAAEGVPLDGFYFCPHDPDGMVPKYSLECECRKPQPGMILKAAQELHLDLERSWFIGDILDDIEAGHRAGCRCVLVDCGGETLWQRSAWRMPDIAVNSLPEAARKILAACQQNVGHDSLKEFSR